ncbi:MAG: diguanylate cyclase [Rhodoferax sp.]|uniref:diguanylate cyclase n=1 Tax=Rhodoferax sp. TaxID=50421 RepID=UPI002624E7B5|nr:diguanylate cyclase [Rhodoferax sp.]MDD2880313.1 diguanylate cyclase [Rhodoferax sp.]
MFSNPSLGTSPSAEADWRFIVQSTPDSCKAIVAQTVADNRHLLADHFYAYMMGHPQASVFLDHEAVHTRLHGSMMRWFNEIFQHPLQDENAVVAHQRLVGEVHARIQVPVHLVARGARLIKLDLSAALAPQFDDLGLFEKSVSYVGQLIDLAMELMSASYERNSQRSAREDEAYRLYSVGQNIAVERERQRAVLMEWGQEVMFSLHRSTGNDALPSLGKSEFGLWFHHKAAGIFDRDPEVAEISAIIDRVDHTLLPMLRAPSMEIRPRDVLIQDLQSELKTLQFHLSSLFERHQEAENGRDTLTRLLTRRFLPAVMNREMQVAQTRKSSFALLLLDLDHFKRVNDEYGHDVGDMVLQQAANLLMNCVRNGDFIFRYGGEELLVLLVEVNKEAALRLAENIRHRFESSAFNIGQGRVTHVTASIGVALYSGHPDHQHLIKQADDAMYEAKNKGRNQVVNAAFEPDAGALIPAKK